MLPNLSSASPGSYPPQDSKVGRRTGVPKWRPVDGLPPLELAAYACTWEPISIAPTTNAKIAARLRRLTMFKAFSRALALPEGCPGRLR
jgi:hypothetical protein